jgi:ACS family hexuronate transporter-like MFS transporter
VVVGFLCLVSTSNYFDRQVFFVLVDIVKRDLGFSATDYVDITSAFFFIYTVMYFVGGWIVDRIGTRRSFFLFVFVWSLAIMVYGLAIFVGGFQAAHLFLNTAQPVNFPAKIRAAAEWFPMRKKTLAIGIFNAETAISSTLAMPVVSAVTLLAGWWAHDRGRLGLPVGGGGRSSTACCRTTSISARASAISSTRDANRPAAVCRVSPRSPG